MKQGNCCGAWSAIRLPEVKSAPLIGEQLLTELGLRKSLAGEADHPAIAWHKSGLLALSGKRDGPARMVPVPLASSADGAMLALKSLSNNPQNLPENGAILLGERARLMGLTRNGQASSGGHCRLIETRKGRFAINLARASDWDLLEAWLEEPACAWDDIERIAQSCEARQLVHRGAELGMAIAFDSLPLKQPWFVEHRFQPADNSSKRPLVVDLSSLWAGPLAGNLLHLMGAQIVKVESHSRPDGARQGNGAFYHVLNADKQCAAFDFTSTEGRFGLKKLINAADIVIEASRPRALKQLGIDAEDLTRQKPGKLWLRLVAHGGEESRIGFGDDIGVGAGLSSIMEKAWGEPCFVGDAIADPLSGIFGALAAWTKWQAGGGYILDLSMRDIVCRAMQLDHEEPDWNKIAVNWQAMADANSDDLYSMRAPSGAIEGPGDSTNSIMASLC